MKLYYKKNCEQDRMAVQSDLSKLVDWNHGNKYILSLWNAVMHIWNRKIDSVFMMADHYLTEVYQQRDLEISITNDLKWRNQAWPC